MRTRRRRWVRFPAALGTPLVVLGLACPAGVPDRSQGSGEVVEGAPDRLHAVLVNGGGRPQINYHSHLDHLRRLLRLLEATGVDPARIAVFSGDGPDPASDLATREGELPRDFWLLPSSVSSRLRPPIEYIDSQIDGVSLRPATREALSAWFDAESTELAPGDTLLFYVTDHGEKNEHDLRDNTITLWGDTLSVSELRDLLALLHPGVRVVMLMSQCYSGAFANAAFRDVGEPLPRGNVCGYFSAPADRKAHGCYAEVSGRDATGHSHRFFEALASVPRLSDAQLEVLVSDGTPDVPNATSSFFLAKLLEAAAERGGHETAGLVDLYLGEALLEPQTWEREIRLLDRVGKAFGFASPRSLTQLDAQGSGLPELRERFETYADRWEGALAALRLANLGEFQATSSAWRTRLEPGVLATLDASQRPGELNDLLRALTEFTEANADRDARLRNLHHKYEESKAARYRSDVRLAAVLRMRTLLMDVAGRHYAARYASVEERDALAQLDACEDLALVAPEEKRGGPRPPEPFPSLGEERQRLEAIAPGWLGLRYRAPRAGERKRHELPAGAAIASEVFPDSPAAEAGLQVADVILGPPGEPFQETHALREWVMRAEIGRPLPLQLLRDGEELRVSVSMARYPLELPALLGPPRIGRAAPPLELEYLPGVQPAGPSQSRLLFFWATWCSHCKNALPELMAFGRERGVPIVAITDEYPEEVEAFLAKYDGPVPEIIATDHRRVNFQRFGVSGTPTFALVDAEGILRHYETGYDAAKGLGIGE